MMQAASTAGTSQMYTANVVQPLVRQTQQTRRLQQRHKRGCESATTESAAEAIGMEIQAVVGDPIEDTVEPIEVESMEAEVTHEPVTNAAVEATATEEPREYSEWVVSMQKEIDAFKAYDCMEEHDESEALTQGLV
eukprot:3917715-Amphidinium_carterae.5